MTYQVRVTNSSKNWKQLPGVTKSYQELPSKSNQELPIFAKNYQELPGVPKQELTDMAQTWPIFPQFEQIFDQKQGIPCHELKNSFDYRHEILFISVVIMEKGNSNFFGGIFDPLHNTGHSLFISVSSWQNYTPWLS